MIRLAEQTPKVIETVQRCLPKDFHESVAQSILKGLKSQAQKLAVSR
ncbi:MAG: hypothetical protein IT581_18990 [Verrucomicrobiales bacterium]|nr:hypothetical protein [Verrucomicrobiales bacterium]